MNALYAIVALLAMAAVVSLVFARRRSKTPVSSNAVATNATNSSYAGSSLRQHEAPPVTQPASESDATADAATSDEEEEDVDAQPEEDETPMSAAELIAQGDKHYAAFELDDAISSYEEAIESIREKSGRDALELVPVFMKLGDAFVARDIADWDEDTYEDAYTRALAINIQHKGALDASNEPIVRAMLALYERLQNFNRVDALLYRLQKLQTIPPALAEACKPALSDLKFSANDDGWRGEVASALDSLKEFDYDTGIESLESAIESAQQELGAFDPLIADLSVRLGIAYQARDDDEDDDSTEPSDYLQAVGIGCRSAEPSATLMTAFTMLVAFYDQTGQHGKANRYLNRLLS